MGARTGQAREQVQVQVQVQVREPEQPLRPEGKREQGLLAQEP